MQDRYRGVLMSIPCFGYKIPLGSGIPLGHGIPRKHPLESLELASSSEEPVLTRALSVPRTSRRP